MILTLWVGVRSQLFRSPSRLAYVLYHDGIVHYIYLASELLIIPQELMQIDLLRLVFALANLILYIAAPVRLETS